MNWMTRWVKVCSSLALLGAPVLAQNTTCVSVSSAGFQGNLPSAAPSLSADGRFVAFASFTTFFATGDTNGAWDVFVRDRLSGTTERVSVDSNGVEGNGGSATPSISADGRFVAFLSGATNLVAGDTNGVEDIFVRDRLSGTTERVSVDSGALQGSQSSWGPSISADGRFVAFQSSATDLVVGDTNGLMDIFVRDRLGGTTELVSVDSGALQGNQLSNSPSLSADGRFIAFESLASNLVAGDTNGLMDIFVRDRQVMRTERVSVGAVGVEGNGHSRAPSISADGRYVAFCALASNLFPGDSNGFPDVFVHDRNTGTTECVSVDSTGTLGNASSGTTGVSISADGHCVAFGSLATNLIGSDTNGQADIFVHDRLSVTTVRVSVGPYGSQADLSSATPALPTDGRFVVFESDATNLVASDHNGATDIFVRDQRGPPPPPPTPTVFCYADGSDGLCPCGNYGVFFGGCQNSTSSFWGGAGLTPTGDASLTGDTLVLTADGEPPTALSILLQGDVSIAGTTFGDGLRCTGGALKRLYTRNAVGGAVSVPASGSLPISARSAALGDVLSANTTRYYQTYYQDPNSTFCLPPSGSTWNITSGLVVVWGP